MIKKIRIKSFIVGFLLCFNVLFSSNIYTIVYSYEGTDEQTQVTYQDFYFLPLDRVIEKESKEVYSEIINLDKIKINYYDTLYVTEKLNRDKIQVLGIFNDKKVIDITEVCDLTVNNNTIECTLGDITKTLKVPIVQIESVVYSTKEPIYENNVLPDGEIVVSYENRKVETVEFTNSRTMALGKNEFSYKGFKFNITAEEEPWTHKILRENKKEIDNADNLYTSDTLVISEKKHSYFDSDYVYISHVFTRNNNQIKVQPSKDKLYDGSTESPITFSERHKPRLLINGGGFNIRSDFMPTRFSSSVYYLNGEHINNVITSSGTELFVSYNGTLFSEKNKTIEELEKLNVHSSLTFKENPLIKDGEKQNLDNYNYAPRSGIGMVKPGEYYVVLAGHSNYSNGLTLAQLRDIFYDLGCTYAFNLDGGGSSTLMIDNKMINESAQSNVRPVVNYICFYD